MIDIHRLRDFPTADATPIASSIERNIKSASLANFHTTRNTTSLKAVPQVSVRLDAKKKNLEKNKSMFDPEAQFLSVEDSRKFALQQPKEQYLSIVGQMSGDHNKLLHSQKMQNQQRVLKKVSSMALSYASGSDAVSKKEKLQNSKGGGLDFKSDQLRYLSKKGLEKAHLRFVEKQMNERTMQQEKLKAANLSYERSMLDLSVKYADEGRKKGIRTNYDTTRPEPKYTRMKKKVNLDNFKTEKQMIQQQSMKPYL